MNNNDKCDPPGIKKKLYPTEIFGRGIRISDDETITAASTLTEPLTLQPPLSLSDDDSLMDDHNTTMYQQESNQGRRKLHLEEDDDDKLLDSEKQEQFDAFLLKAKYLSCSIGLITGCFIQFSSLGANFLLTSLWGYDVFIQREFVALSLLWCFATSIMGVLILLFLRGLVVLAFRATTATTKSILSNVADSSRKNNMAQEETQNFIAKLIVTIECSFAISSLVGVCLSWTMTDIILDMKGHILHSVITLIVALVWCKFVMKCCSKNHQKNTNKELLMTKTDQQDYFHYHYLPSDSNCSNATVDAVIA